MEYRQLGASGLKVPVLSLGTGTFSAAPPSSFAPGARDGNDGRRYAARRHLPRRRGLSLFDSADIYSGGESERVLGHAIRGRRDRVLISTKGTFRSGDGPNDVGSSRHHLIAAVEGSLTRLGTDYIDLYQLHGFDAQTPIEETLQTLDDLVRAGKIRYVGCSNFSGWHLMKSLALAEQHSLPRYVAHQAYYSLVGRDYEHELMPLALDQKVGCVVWSPLGWGRLTGKVRRGQRLPTTSRLHHKRVTEAGPQIDDEYLYRVVDAIDEVAKETGKSVPQIALNWLLQRPTIANVIIGARDEAQLRDNLGAVGWQLDATQIAQARRRERATEALSLLAPSDSSSATHAAGVTHRRRRVRVAGSDGQTTARHQCEGHAALGYMVLAALAAMAYIAQDIGVGVLLGVLTAFMLEPLYERILRRWSRPWLAQLSCILIAALSILLGLIGISAVFLTRGSAIVTKVVSSLEPHGSLRAQFGQLSEKLKPFGLQLTTLVDNIRHAHSIREVVTSVGSYAANLATTIATETFRGMLSFFFLLLTAGFVLARGRAIEQSAERMMPISPRHTRTLIAEFRRVGRAVLLGSVVTGVAQGVCAGLIFWAVGLPEPLFFGMLTAVASLFPGVGTMLVCVPAGICFLATGQVRRGIIELGTSAFVVIGFCDYVLRPRLVGGGVDAGAAHLHRALRRRRGLRAHRPHRRAAHHVGRGCRLAPLSRRGRPDHRARRGDFTRNLIYLTRKLIWAAPRLSAESTARTASVCAPDARPCGKRIEKLSSRSSNTPSFGAAATKSPPSTE